MFNLNSLNNGVKIKNPNKQAMGTWTTSGKTFLEESENLLAAKSLEDLTKESLGKLLDKNNRGLVDAKNAIHCAQRKIIPCLVGVMLDQSSPGMVVKNIIDMNKVLKFLESQFEEWKNIDFVEAQKYKSQPLPTRAQNLTSEQVLGYAMRTNFGNPLPLSVLYYFVTQCNNQGKQPFIDI